jgi:hypothetical protein
VPSAPDPEDQGVRELRHPRGLDLDERSCAGVRTEGRLALTPSVPGGVLFVFQDRRPLDSTPIFSSTAEEGTLLAQVPLQGELSRAL